MKLSNGYKMRFILVGFLAAIVFGGGSAKADFTFGEPTNLGPTVNSSFADEASCISADGLELYFDSTRPGGYGTYDLWVARRITKDEPWGEPVNLGPNLNSGDTDLCGSISNDGLHLYFSSRVAGGYGERDIYVSTRATKQSPWDTPVNLGQTVNSTDADDSPVISPDGLELVFYSDRPGGSGRYDLWVTTRATTHESWREPANLGPTVNSSAVEGGPRFSSDGLTLFFSAYNRSGGYGSFDLWMTNRTVRGEPWGVPQNLGPAINTSHAEGFPSISIDGRTLYFCDYPNPRPGGVGGDDLWQVSIDPIVDFNGDRIVDADDMCIMVDHWGENYSLCDIGPMPWGDGVVDVQDLIVLAEHLFEKLPGRPIEP